MIYSSKIESIARRYNVEPRAVVFAYAIAAGCSRADAFQVIFTRGNASRASSEQQADTMAAELVEDAPGLRVLVQRIKNKTHGHSDAAQEVADEERKKEGEEEREKKRKELANEYADKSRIIGELAESLGGLKGKDRAAVLMQIADLQRMKQEETRTEEERRRFFLPYVSACRSCALMRCYVEAQEEAGGSV